MKHLKIALIFCLIIIGSKSYGQARTSVGIAYGVYKPYSDYYKFSRGLTVQANIALEDRWAIVPAIEYKSLYSKTQVIYSFSASPNFYNYLTIRNIDLMYVGASAKYHFADDWFAKAGPVFYVAGGNEDIASLGIGGTAGAGYNLNLDKHSTLELSLNTDVINISQPDGDGITPVASFKIAYMFNFKARKP